MKNKKLEANLSMAVSKVFSGLNMNALKYLLPLWMSPLTGATLRCTFAAAAFWVIGWFMPPEKSSAKDKWLLFLLGALGLYGFMFLYLAGLSKTTPVSSSIFTSLQPIWVFLMMIFFYKEKATTKKIIGISIGLIGALVCILTQQSDDLASDAFTGNMLCLLSSVVYAVYLILSQRILTAIGAITMLRYTFSGAAVSAIIVTFITGFDAPVFSMPFHWTPFLILMFVLIFPTTISYMLLPVGLKYLKTTVVAIYGYLILIVATIASLALGQDRFSWTQTFAIIFICIGEYCLNKKGVTESFPFDDVSLVVKVMNKMFALIDLEEANHIALKCDPEKAIELREHYSGIEGAYHFNKKYWNSVRFDSDVDDKLMKELIDHSYDEVIKKFTKKLRAEYDALP